MSKLKQIKSGDLYFEGAKYYDSGFSVYIDQLPDGYELIDGHVMLEGDESDEIRPVNDNDFINESQE